jgi:two-component system phosphate regulon response regulator PhoB
LKGAPKQRIIVSGTESSRLTALCAQLDSKKYSVLVTFDVDSVRSQIDEGGILAHFILYSSSDPRVARFIELRANLPTIFTEAIVIVSRSNRDNDFIRSQNYPIDEYLIEPVSGEELSHVLSDLTILRKRDSKKLIFAYGPLIVDRKALQFSLGKTQLRLHPMSAKILEILMRRPGRVYTRSEIINEVWGKNSNVDNRTVDVMVGRIRDATKHRLEIDMIRTFRDVGYAINEQLVTTRLVLRRAKLDASKM